VFDWRGGECVLSGMAHLQQESLYEYYFNLLSPGRAEPNAFFSSYACCVFQRGKLSMAKASSLWFRGLYDSMNELLVSLDFYTS
jgi:hypothetical protein